MNRLPTTDAAGVANDSLDWGLLQIFIAMCESGSLGRAARALGVSQPTLSRRLAALEAALGQALFERTSHGLVPTAAGEALREPATRMRAEANALALAAERQSRSVAGTVRITASDAVSTFVLLPLLRELRTAHPQIQIELIPSDRAEDLIERKADIAVRMFRPREPALIARRLADMPLGFYAHRSYLAGRPRLRPDTMHLHEWIGLDRSDQMLTGFAAAGQPVARGFFGFRCDDSVVNWHAVCAGLGVGVALQSVAVGSRGVVQLLKEVPITPLQTWLTVHRELRGTPRLRAVFDALARGLTRK